MERVQCVLSCFSCVQLFVTLWAVARQAPLSMGFSSQDTGVGCHALLQGIFQTWQWNPHLFCLLHWQADSLPLAPPGSNFPKRDLKIEWTEPPKQRIKETGTFAKLKKQTNKQKTALIWAWQGKTHTLAWQFTIRRDHKVMDLFSERARNLNSTSGTWVPQTHDFEKSMRNKLRKTTELQGRKKPTLKELMSRHTQPQNQQWSMWLKNAWALGERSILN